MTNIKNTIHPTNTAQDDFDQKQIAENAIEDATLSAYDWGLAKKPTTHSKGHGKSYEISADEIGVPPDDKNNAHVVGEAHASLTTTTGFISGSGYDASDVAMMCVFSLFKASQAEKHDAVADERTTALTELNSKMAVFQNQICEINEKFKQLDEKKDAATTQFYVSLGLGIASAVTSAVGGMGKVVGDSVAKAATAVTQVINSVNSIMNSYAKMQDATIEDDQNLKSIQLSQKQLEMSQALASSDQERQKSRKDTADQNVSAMRDILSRTMQTIGETRVRILG